MEIKPINSDPIEFDPLYDATEGETREQRFLEYSETEPPYKRVPLCCKVDELIKETPKLENVVITDGEFNF